MVSLDFIHGFLTVCWENIESASQISYALK